MFNGMILSMLLNQLPVINTGHDKIPDFAAQPTVVSVASGAWINRHIWSTGKVPGPDDVVRIDAGHDVALDSGPGDPLTCAVLGVAGELHHRSGELRVGTVLVYPSGTYEAAFDNVTLVIRDTPVTDPDQFGTGLIVLGEFRTVEADEPAVPYGYAVPMPGAMQITGSNRLLRGMYRIAFADEREPWQFEFNGWMKDGNQVEELPCEVGPGGMIRLHGQLKYGHAADVPYAIWNDQRFTIRSENPNGTRGHVLIAGDGKIDVTGVLFENLGRTTGAALHPVTNHIGRYSLHLHHLHHGGHRIHRCAIVHNKRWGLAIHDCHNVQATQNLIYDTQGAGIVLEQGSEHGCRIAGNYVLLVHGAEDLEIQQRGEEASQRAGAGLWVNTAAAGSSVLTKNMIVSNIVANVRGVAYNFFMPHYDDTSVSGKASRIWTSRSPFFWDNLAYSCVIGVEGWRITDPLRIEEFTAINCQIGLSAPFDAFPGIIVESAFLSGTQRYPQNDANTPPDPRWASCGMRINGGYLGKLDATDVHIEGFDYGIYNDDNWPKWGVQLTKCSINNVHTAIHAPWILTRDDLRLFPDTGWFLADVDIRQAKVISNFPLPGMPTEAPAMITRDIVAIP